MQATSELQEMLTSKMSLSMSMRTLRGVFFVDGCSHFKCWMRENRNSVVNPRWNKWQDINWRYGWAEKDPSTRTRDAFSDFFPFLGDDGESMTSEDFSSNDDDWFTGWWLILIPTTCLSSSGESLTSGMAIGGWIIGPFLMENEDANVEANERESNKHAVMKCDHGRVSCWDEVKTREEKAWAGGKRRKRLPSKGATRVTIEWGKKGWIISNTW